MLRFETVMLWSYGKVRNAPAGCEPRNANDLVPCEKAKTLVNWYGHKAIAQVSDCVRLLAVTRFGGWVTDADNVWLRPPPLGDYHFATLPMKRTGGRANQRLPTTAAWGRQPSREWDGKGHSGTPMHFPSLPSKFAQDVAEFVTKFMNENCSRRQDQYGWGVKRITRATPDPKSTTPNTMNA